MLNRRLLSDRIFKSSGTLLVTPETLREYEAILPGSADRILSLAEAQQIQWWRFRRLIQILGFIVAMALIALSAYSVSLGFDLAALVFITSGIAGAAVIFIFK